MLIYRRLLRATTSCIIDMHYGEENQQLISSWENYVRETWYHYINMAVCLKQLNKYLMANAIKKTILGAELQEIKQHTCIVTE